MTDDDRKILDGVRRDRVIRERHVQLAERQKLLAALAPPSHPVIEKLQAILIRLEASHAHQLATAEELRRAGDQIDAVAARRLADLLDVHLAPAARRN
jgi:hypothetical protein